MSNLTELVISVQYHVSKMRLSEHYELILARTGLFDLKWEIYVKLVDLHSPSAYFKIAKFWPRRKKSIDGKRCCNETKR